MPSYKTWQEFRIYRPNREKNGAATRFQMRLVDSTKVKGQKRVLFFLESAVQTGEDENGNAKFAWQEADKRVIMKLEALDMGEIIAVINHHKEQVGGGKGLYHEHSGGNTVLNFARAKNGGFYFGVSSKKKDGGAVLQIKHLISDAEAIILKVLLEDAILRIYGR